MSTLAGRHIVVTRALHQAEELSERLRKRGATALEYPCIAISPPDDPAPLTAALEQLSAGAFDWLVITSVNTVRVLSQYMLPIPDSVEIAAVGSATAAAVRRHLVGAVNVIPDTFTGEALAAALPAIDGARVLVPQSALADDTLSVALAARGAHVTTVDAYQTHVGTGGVDLPALLRARSVDAITLASASAAANLVVRLANEGAQADALDGVCIACIGTSTAEAAAADGLAVQVVPAVHTLDGLVEALEHYFEDTHD